ncbi:COMM domain-containing protein 7 isoform X1 [Onychomys torridus]|uniref:COMM domain-containing protein 7 isoform X1 n=1 Tax=Onychomys torridus TaxID=38674 RepID=UPI00167F49DA|nr:COMM domain-containing protein 7 isoform X1 [Onychomys torridus]
MGRLHCTQDPVPEAVRGDMQQLNQLGAQQFSALTEVLFHFLTEPKEVERFLAQLSEFATANQMSLGPLKSIMKSLLLVPNGALKKGLTAEQVRTDLLTLGLSEEKATYFSEKWKQNAPTLAQWAIGQTLMINQLIDMEWRFGVTSGSSELEKVGSIFLQVRSSRLVRADCGLLHLSCLRDALSVALQVALLPSPAPGHRHPGTG